MNNVIDFKHFKAVKALEYEIEYLGHKIIIAEYESTQEEYKQIQKDLIRMKVKLRRVKGY